MNKKILVFAMTATLLAGFASTAFSANPRIPSDERIDRAIQAQEIDNALAPIKSRLDLIRYMTNNRGNPENPLNALSSRNKQRFLNSLRFGDSGLASFSYVELESSNLTVKQAHRLLSLFGIQAFTASLHGLRQEDSADRLIMQKSAEIIDDGGGLLDKHWCSSRATCSESTNSKCILASC
jgi:hypothetical protein